MDDCDDDSADLFADRDGEDDLLASAAHTMEYVMQRLRSDKVLDSHTATIVLNNLMEHMQHSSMLLSCYHAGDGGSAVALEDVLGAFVTSAAVCTVPVALWAHDTACGVLRLLHWVATDSARTSETSRRAQHVVVAAEAVRLRFGQCNTAAAAKTRSAQQVYSLYTSAIARFAMWYPHTLTSVLRVLPLLLQVEVPHAGQEHRCPPALAFLCDDMLCMQWSACDRAALGAFLGAHMLRTHKLLWPADWHHCTQHSATRAMVQSECVCGTCGTAPQTNTTQCIRHWVCRAHRTAWLIATAALSLSAAGT